jgi:hypothetical protein
MSAVTNTKRKVILIIEEDEPKRYVASGCIGKWFYNEFIRSKLSKEMKKKFDDLLKDEDEDFVDYYRVSIQNPSDPAWGFSTLWFFDVLDTGMLPVYISGINTSSAMAMSMCGLDRDDEDDDDAESKMTEVDDIVNFGATENNKKIIRELLALKR